MGKWVHRLSEIDEKARTASCSNCGSVGIHSHGVGKWRCKGKLYPERSDNITANGICPICKQTAKLVWDHDHISGQERELICLSCNLLLGYARDDSQILVEAILYLERHPTDLNLDLLPKMELV